MDTIKDVSELVKAECFKETNPYGAQNSWEHMNHVARLSKSFAGDTGADEEIVELAAWLHDWSAIQGFYEDHHERGSIVAGEILEKLGYPKDKTKHIQRCVFTHRSSKGIKPETVEAECVANADAIAHFLEIPDLLCSKHSDGGMTIKEVVDWLKAKLKRDLGKITLDVAKEMVAPYHEATKLILGEF